MSTKSLFSVSRKKKLIPQGSKKTKRKANHDFAANILLNYISLKVYINHIDDTVLWYPIPSPMHDALDNFQQLFGDLLKAHSTKDLKTFKREINHLFGDNLQQFIQYAGKLRSTDYSEIVFNSFVMLLHGRLENDLKKICDVVRDDLQLPVRASELSGDTLSKHVNYLTKLAGIPAESLKSYSQVSDFSKVRNCIVHTSGYIEKSSDKARIIQLAKMPQSKLFLNADDGTDMQVLLGIEYCEMAIEHVIRFLEEILVSTGLSKQSTMDAFNRFMNYLNQVEKSSE